MKFIKTNLNTLSIICILTVLFSLVISHKHKSRRTKTKGNFNASCKNTKLTGSTLSSECKMMNGNWMQTSVNLSNCITNRNGSLQLGGAYDRSSRNCRLEGGATLVCNSRTMRGNWRDSRIFLGGFISNIDGVFKGCGRATANVIKPVVQKVVRPNYRPIVQPIVLPVVKPVVKPYVKPLVKPLVQPIVQKRTITQNISANVDDRFERNENTK
jgi:hypothetical protein